MGVYDVPAQMLIEEIAKDLKAKIKQPAFVPYVKTGTNRERAPNNPDWYFTRAASILYRVYKEGEIGTGSLRSHYGGRKNRGVRPEHKFKASGKIIRSCLQAIEKEGLVKKGKKGRVITPKGEKLLFEKAKIAEVAFSATKEKEKADFAERLAKIELAKQKAKEARIALEAAKKQAEQAKAEALKKATAAAASLAGQKTPETTAATATTKPVQGNAQKPTAEGQKQEVQKLGQAKHGTDAGKAKEAAKEQKKDYAPAG